MLSNILLSIVLVLLIIQFYIIHFIIKYTRGFLEEIRGVKGFQFSTLDIGDNAPLFRVSDSNNHKIVLKDKLENSDTIMLFVNTECSSCNTLIQSISESNSKYSLPIFLINNDTSNSDFVFLELLKDKVNYIKSPQIFSNYHINITPYFVLVGMNEKIKSQGEIKDFKHLQYILVNYIELDSHKQDTLITS
ncbi:MULTISPECIES: redoxin domain-containing protein [unclassified Sporosarcina]|uniref:redoxin domain-containing protein n=1 Tax=unclassified Sporosarcina TaxID=2647733 RepID=UPI001A929DBE|nr:MULTISPECIES: redoxin domain-containing protein [unclassified Sporosarcina]MBO0587577.1 redoxin domain-containing protein [Sporosarcina sp. E16_8]MBO0602436.1 redoxin domain-containing protein [Sporosarcina sp. E16_3]